MDLGQGTELEDVRDRALAAGAVRAHVLDVREEFARDYVLPALKADAMLRRTASRWRPRSAGRSSRGSSSRSPRIEQATAVAHGGAGTATTGRARRAARALDPTITVIAPARDWGMTRPRRSTTRARGIPCRRRRQPYAPTRICGAGRSSAACSTIRGGAARGDLHADEAAADCPDEPAYVEIAFERGVPAAINGVAMPLSS